jgi:F-type H+-transporting ATPase subunit epsilon
MSLNIQIMTPDKIFLKQQVEEIILPTNTGQIGILKNHAPLITALDIGVLLLRSQNKWIPIALMGGFALIKKNQVTILVNEAESVETLNPETVEKTFAEAKEKLEQATTSKEKVEANFLFKRERARYQVLFQTKTN